MHKQSENSVFPFSFLSDEQPAWHAEKYVIPSAPQIGENLSKSQAQVKLQTGSNVGFLEVNKLFN